MRPTSLAQISMDRHLVLEKQENKNIHLGEKRPSFFLIILSLSICIFNNLGDYLNENVCSKFFLHSKPRKKFSLESTEG